jgi:ribonuclease HII
MHKTETNLKQRGYQYIAGVDEAGRGPLAGPVVAAAVILPDGYKNKEIRDSKKLTPFKREQLFIEIKNTAISYAAGIVGWREIDEMGILEATKLAMRRAVMLLNPKPDFILIDAVPINVIGIPQMTIIHGDAIVFSIAAASIIAKVTRDHLMQKYDKQFPQYGFREHMGYGTEIHLKAIREHGPCQIHRMSFSPFAEINSTK